MSRPLSSPADTGKYQYRGVASRRFRYSSWNSRYFKAFEGHRLNSHEFEDEDSRSLSTCTLGTGPVSKAVVHLSILPASTAFPLRVNGTYCVPANALHPIALANEISSPPATIPTSLPPEHFHNDPTVPYKQMEWCILRLRSPPLNKETEECSALKDH